MVPRRFPPPWTIGELDPGFVVKEQHEWKTAAFKPMEVTVKLRLLLTSALLMFVQMPAPRAQVTVDVVKITCEPLMMAVLPWTSRDIVLRLSGYYHGQHEQHDHRTHLN
jgi:hypothetical protein